MFYLSDRVSQPDGPHAIQFSKTLRSLARPVQGCADKTGTSSSQRPRDARMNRKLNLADQPCRSSASCRFLDGKQAFLGRFSKVHSSRVIRTRANRLLPTLSR